MCVSLSTQAEIFKAFCTWYRSGTNGQRGVEFLKENLGSDFRFTHEVKTILQYQRVNVVKVLLLCMG